MLGSLHQEANWAVCSIEALPTLLAFIGTLVGASLTLGRKNAARNWTRAAAFQARVPWSEVRQHYSEDALLYKAVTSAPHHGCVAHFDTAELRRTWARVRNATLIKR